MRDILKRLLLSALLFAAGYAVYRLAGAKAPTGTRPPSPELAAKMKAAEDLLAAHEAERAAFLARLAAGSPRPEDFTGKGEAEREFLDIETRYTDKFNALALPCATCREAAQTEGYQDWSARYAEAQLAGLKKFNQAYAGEVSRAMSPKQGGL